MRRSPGTTQTLARAPGLLVSTVLTCMIGALLPPLAGLVLFVGGLALLAALCSGGLERPAVRLVGRARALSQAESAALAPTIALLCQKGLGPPMVVLYVRDGDVGTSAGAVGRRSVVLSAGLVRSCQQGQLPTDQATGVIAAAVARIRLGQTRFDLVVEFWTIPWRLLRAVCLAIAKAVGLFPLTTFAWRVRFMVTSVAVVQSTAEGHTASGVVVAVVTTLTYLSPRWQRQCERRLQDDADRCVVEHGLGDPLGRFLRRRQADPGMLERIHRLIDPDARPSLALVVSQPTLTGRN